MSSVQENAENDTPGAGVWGLIAAAGSGRRMESATPKQYLDLGGVPIIARSINALAALPEIQGTVVGLAADDDRFAQLAPALDEQPRATFIGGDTRAQTVLNGLKVLEAFAAPGDWVLVHDAARPFVTPGDLTTLIETLGIPGVGGAVLGWPLADSLARVDDHGVVTESVSRAGLWRTATPQAFRLNELIGALEDAVASGVEITDELSAMRRAGVTARLVECSRDNFKITTAADLAQGEKIIASRIKNRVGKGFDVHAFEAGRRLVLGGVEIDFEKGLAGHSDADVALHALCDALLGAAALGDIGHHFPDTDSKWAGADSRVLLREVVGKVRGHGFSISNVDITVIAQAPRLAPYVATMVENIASDLGIGADAVNVKATTTEGLGFTGRGEGIAAEAIAMLESDA